MNPSPNDLLTRIRNRDATAWAEFIGLYEGRLLAFARSRLADRSHAEDVVQETFLGFLLSLPNYDPATPLEAFLFSIAAHKLTDVLRKRGQRPLLPILLSSDDDAHPASSEPVSPSRRASSLARSKERRTTEENVLAAALRQLIEHCFSRGEFERLKCLELLCVHGWSNKEVAARLNLSEQAVANHKQFAVQKLRAAAEKARLTDVNWPQLGFGGSEESA